MFARDLKHLDAERWTVAIEDPYLGTMTVKLSFFVQVIDIGWVPVEVVVGCQWIERRGKPQP